MNEHQQHTPARDFAATTTTTTKPIEKSNPKPVYRVVEQQKPTESAHHHFRRPINEIGGCGCEEIEAYVPPPGGSNCEFQAVWERYSERGRA